MQIWLSALLGLLEGLTEFIPVSSTGHLLLAGHFLGFCSPGKTFEVLIQLGAILAILSVYFGRLLHLALSLPRDRGSQRFVLGILAAFLPAAVIGAALHGFIKGVLFHTPMVVAVTLIVGGVILLMVDRMHHQPRYHEVTEIPPGLAFKIGLFQCLAMVPGVSRSGSTIVGAMMLGVGKKAAAEFSFYLAMPTMTGAFAYDLYKNWSLLRAEAVADIAVGFVAAFVSGVFVVRFLLDYISRHGFALFAWWRLIVGSLALAGLLVLGQASRCA